ncbi:hypothetical protein Tco_1378973 [Tanacetum coccineum]
MMRDLIRLRSSFNVSNRFQEVKDLWLQLLVEVDPGNLLEDDIEILRRSERFKREKERMAGPKENRVKVTEKEETGKFRGSTDGLSRHGIKHGLELRQKKEKQTNMIYGMYSIIPKKDVDCLNDSRLRNFRKNAAMCRREAYFDCDMSISRHYHEKWCRISDMFWFENVCTEFLISVVDLLSALTYALRHEIAVHDQVGRLVMDVVWLYVKEFSSMLSRKRNLLEWCVSMETVGSEEKEWFVVGRPVVRSWVCGVGRGMRRRVSEETAEEIQRAEKRRCWVSKGWGGAGGGVTSGDSRREERAMWVGVGVGGWREEEEGKTDDRDGEEETLNSRSVPGRSVD